MEQLPQATPPLPARPGWGGSEEVADFLWFVLPNVHRLVNISAPLRGMPMQELVAESVNLYLSLLAQDRKAYDSNMDAMRIEAEQGQTEMRGPAINPRADVHVLLYELQIDRLSANANSAKQISP
jgi:hypothetical protein